MAGRLRSPLCHQRRGLLRCDEPPARAAGLAAGLQRAGPAMSGLRRYMRTARGGVFSAYMCDWKEKRGGQCARPTPPSVFVVTCDQHCLRCAKEDRGRRMNMSRRGL